MLNPGDYDYNELSASHERMTMALCARLVQRVANKKDALKLLLRRADEALNEDGAANKVQVRPQQIEDFLDEQDLDASERLVYRRVLYASGMSALEWSMPVPINIGIADVPPLQDEGRPITVYLEIDWEKCHPLDIVRTIIEEVTPKLPLESGQYIGGILVDTRWKDEDLDWDELRNQSAPVAWAQRAINEAPELLFMLHQSSMENGPQLGCGELVHISKIMDFSRHKMGGEGWWDEIGTMLLSNMSPYRA